MQTYFVPAGVTSISVDVRGAQGGNGTCVSGIPGIGGRGGRVTSALSVTPGQTLYLFVGGSTTSNVAGYNGGGNGSINYGPGSSPYTGGGGGGASDIRIGGTTLTDRVVIAAGGGGGGGGLYGGYNGGSGGNSVGANGDGSPASMGGHGGTGSSGGAAGTSGGGGTFAFCYPGTFGIGGAGCTGGGGGFYGGGSGNLNGSGGYASYQGGGAGGSSNTSSSLASGVSMSQGYNTGNGSITITAANSPNATTTAATSITSTSVTLNGLISDNGSVTTSSFEYSTSPTLTTAVITLTGSPSSISAGSGSTAVSTSPSGLIPGTTYYYRVKGVNAIGAASGSILSFTTLFNPPTANTNTSTSITSTSAVVNGLVNDNGNTTSVNFDYSTNPTLTTGVTTITGSPSSISAGAGSTIVTASISGLTTGMTYYYRVRATNSIGITNGLILNFTTINTLPSSITNTPTAITANSAFLNGLVNDNGNTTSITFEYSTNPTFTSGVITISGSPSSIAGGTGNTTVTASLSGLLAATTYYYRVRATNIAGTTTGGILNFTTLNNAPIVTTQPAIAINTNSTILIGLVNGNGTTATASFDYSTDPALAIAVTNLPGSPSSVAAGTGSTAISAALGGLMANTTYYFRVKGINTAGTTNGSVLSFTTDNAITIVNGIKANTEAINIFPNPTSTTLNIDAAISIDVVIRNIEGKIIIRKNATKLIDLSQIANGTYLMEFYDSNGILLKRDKLTKI